MQVRYIDIEAERYIERYAHAGEDLALRIYTSHLLGKQPRLVLHGGGSASVKSRIQEITGETTEVLYIQGRSQDLASIDIDGFAACRLERLLRLCELETLDDGRMLAEISSHTISPRALVPSAETLAHALLPGKYVDHSHAHAVLSILARPEPDKIVDDIWNGRARFLPRIVSGFALARAIRDILGEIADIDILLLDKHGVFTWGDSARDSYHRMIHAVEEATKWIALRRSSVVHNTRKVAERRAELAQIAPMVRGAVAKASPGARMIALVSDHPDILALASSDRALQMTQLGPITPDHVGRMRPFPLIIDDACSIDSVEKAVDAFCVRYHAWIDRGVARRRAPVAREDRLPRVIYIRNLGAILLGTSIDEASIVRDFVEHSARTFLDIAQSGEYRSLSEAELFDLECRYLEEEELVLPEKRHRKRRPLSRHIALVTGAASGIGKATATAMLEEGGHVLLVDRDGERLESAHAKLNQRFGRRVAWALADLRKADDARNAVLACLSAFGGLDILVSSVGDIKLGDLAEEEGEHLLEEGFRLNFLSHQWIARGAVCVFKQQGIGGSLLFNASRSAFDQDPRFGPYAIPKAALIALMRQYAVDHGPDGVRANAVNANGIRTRHYEDDILEARAEARGITKDEYFRANLLARETKVEDVARAFVYLATAEATTGCVLTVDGGNPAAFPR